MTKLYLFQVIEMSGVCAASDIWSVGCTVIELLTCVPPYYDLQPMPALYRIVQCCFLLKRPFSGRNAETRCKNIAIASMDPKLKANVAFIFATNRWKYKKEHFATDAMHPKGSDVDQNSSLVQNTCWNGVEDGAEDVPSAKDPTLVIYEKPSSKSPAKEANLGSPVAPEGKGGASPDESSMFSFGSKVGRNNFQKVRC
ncbi:hypothetical protein GW17_00008537 [Ensete ventricosum]|nr:hypothetical protein GW17_00008537 [Ensete ventricosum]